MILKPARPGLIVRDPRSKQPLPPEGRNVPDTPFWRRRLRDRDVIEVQAAPPPEALDATRPPAPATDASPAAARDVSRGARGDASRPPGADASKATKEQEG